MNAGKTDVSSRLTINHTVSYRDLKQYGIMVRVLGLGLGFGIGLVCCIGLESLSTMRKPRARPNDQNLEACTESR